MGFLGERLAQRDLAIGIVPFYTDWPSSFWITALSARTYLFSTLPSRRGVKMVSELIGRAAT